MLINARTEMMALGQARLIVALKERLDSDIEFAGMCNTLMERIDRSKVARVALHRNDRYLSDLKIWLMTMIFDRSLNCEGIDCDWSSVKKSFVKDLFEFLMQNYDFKTHMFYNPRLTCYLAQFHSFFWRLPQQFLDKILRFCRKIFRKFKVHFCNSAICLLRRAICFKSDYR